jgi:DNA replication protein DnaC
MNETPQVQLDNYLKQLRCRRCCTNIPSRPPPLNSFSCAWGALEMIDRERRIQSAPFPVSKSRETYNFVAIPKLNKELVLELARGEWITRRETMLALGNSGIGKTHIGLTLGLAACQHGFRARFTTAALLLHELIKARYENA